MRVRENIKIIIEKDNIYEGVYLSQGMIFQTRSRKGENMYEGSYNTRCSFKTIYV